MNKEDKTEVGHSIDDFRFTPLFTNSCLIVNVKKEKKLYLLPKLNFTLEHL